MPRPRSAAADAAILEAARDLFSEAGLAGVTMEAIARRAGVGKQTVYRRYADRNAVLAAAWLEDAETRVEMPRGRSLEADLSAFLKRLFAALHTSGGPLRHLMGQAQFDEPLRDAFRDSFIDRRREALGDLLRRHRSSAADAEIATAVDTLYGAMWYRLLVGHAPLDAAFAKRLAQQVVAGLGE